MQPHAENTRKLALQTLSNRLEHMSDKMLLKTIRMLSEIGALDLTAIAGTEVTGGQARVGLPGRGSQPSGDRSTSNLVKHAAMLMEPCGQIVAAHLRGKETHHIEPEGRPPPSARASIPTAKTYLHDFDRLDGRSK